MLPKLVTLVTCLLLSAPLASTQGFPGPPPPRAPMGITAIVQLDDVINQAQTAAYPGTSPPYPNPAADAVLVSYFTTLLNNPAVSGLAATAKWSFLNPNDPGLDPFHPAAGAYVWNTLDDVFIAVNKWNRAHSGSTPKIIQLLPNAGFNAPGWVFTNIDKSVCGGRANCTGSCDGLFMTPLPPVSSHCGYTTLFYRTESNPIQQQPLPMPWNLAYKAQWYSFLLALRLHIQQEPGSSAFVSIAMAGPTASSTEMSLPSTRDQSLSPYPPTNPDPNSTNVTGGQAFLTLLTPGVVPADETATSVDVPTAWNSLFENYYGPNPSYQNSDLPFIEEWDSTIDAYGLIFNGITLGLTPNDDPLPYFPVAATSPLLIPAPGFESDCGNDPQGSNPTPDLGDAMSCAAITQILTHFTNSPVGGYNGKSTQGDGLGARAASIDLGSDGIKWLASTTASGHAPLPATPFRMSRILGGAQFDKVFSGTHAQIEFEGCPHPSGDCVGSGGAPFSPSEGLQNVLSLSYFPGTAVAPSFCAFTDPAINGCGSSSIDTSNWMFSNAPMNFMQVYDRDILYASGLSQCSTVDFTGRPASPGVTAMPPDVTACAALSPPDASDVQSELNLASQKLLSIAEPNLP